MDEYFMLYDTEKYIYMKREQRRQKKKEMKIKYRKPEKNAKIVHIYNFYSVSTLMKCNKI